ncbi:uncharacterized protein LOC131934658 isoform X2 [Physella acuta]|uniref:uncharacterized protein LOC131934658 isoform X2 n=1 Tax=Physella acuta TaxID=109671 RepID=UPI0027DC8761|nr:uncharacterized protein LOC131934658 isoform X2 [Physella acuta]
MSSQVVNDFYNTRKSASHKRKAVDDNPYDADVKPKKVAYIESLNNNKAKMKDVSNQENENEKILHSMLLTASQRRMTSKISATLLGVVNILSTKISFPCLFSKEIICLKITKITQCIIWFGPFPI